MKDRNLGIPGTGSWRKRLGLGTMGVALLSFGSFSCGALESANGRAELSQEGPSPGFRASAAEDDESLRLEVRVDTVLKASPTDSRELGRSEKCYVKAGTTLRLSEPVKGWGRHWKVHLENALPRCSIREGFFFDEHVSVSLGGRGGYTLPMQGAFVTSDWCVCRSVGTSPHIGLDLASNRAMRSVALSDGQVEDVVFVPSCGWEVLLRDRGGALWSYLHLDRPPLSAGQQLRAGDLVGRHGSYPQAGCGTGPHLHLERLSSGAFGDGASGRSCQGVFRSCNYDPRAPFPGVLGQTTRSLVSIPQVVVGRDDALVRQPSLEGRSGESLCSPHQPEARENDLVLDEDFGTEPNAEGHWLTGRVSRATSPAGSRGISWELHLASDAGASTGEPMVNRKNSCQDSPLGEGSCIAAYELYVENTEGHVYRLVSDQDASNQELEVPREARYCTPEGTFRRYGVRALLGTGEWLTLKGVLEGEP